MAWCMHYAYIFHKSVGKNLNKNGGWEKSKKRACLFIRQIFIAYDKNIRTKYIIMIDLHLQ
jgi:hypothetical protein